MTSAILVDSSNIAGFDEESVALMSSCDKNRKKQAFLDCVLEKCEKFAQTATIHSLFLRARCNLTIRPSASWPSG